VAKSRAALLAVLTALGIGFGVPPVAAADNRIHFQPCSRATAGPDSTNLRTTAISDDEPDSAPYDFAPSAAQVTLEHGLRLTLPDGLLGSGSGFDTAYGVSEEKLTRVAAGPVQADVTLAIADSPQSGRRVAFVELRLAPDPPVDWTEKDALAIGTDGGDGGFFASQNLAPPGSDIEKGVDDYVEAFFPGGNSASGIDCLVRRDDNHPLPTGFLFNTGYGDGGYPTLLGRDGSGQIVSVVSYGFVVPWKLSGLPGKPPQFVVDESARRLATPDPPAPVPGIAPGPGSAVSATAPGSGSGQLPIDRVPPRLWAVAAAATLAIAARIFMRLRRRST
jgi:hypothetical protein